MQKQISTLAGISIILAVTIIGLGGVFTYQYLVTKPALIIQSQKNSSNPTSIMNVSLEKAALSYPNPYDASQTDTFTLVNGHALLSDAGNIKPRSYDVATTATGDLIGNGTTDGAIGIYQGWGANRITPIVFVVSDTNGKLTQLDSVVPDTSNWSDETQITSLSISNDILSVNLLTLAPSDQSLPHYEQQASVPETVQYKLVNGRLVLIQPNQTTTTNTVQQLSDDAIIGAMNKLLQLQFKKDAQGFYEATNSYATFSINLITKGDLNEDGFQDALVQWNHCGASCGNAFTVIINKNGGINTFNVVPSGITLDSSTQSSIKSININNGIISITADIYNQDGSTTTSIFNYKLVGNNLVKAN